MNAQTKTEPHRPRTRLQIENDILSRAGFDADGVRTDADSVRTATVSLADVWNYAHDLRKSRTINADALWRAMKKADVVLVRDYRMQREWCLKGEQLTQGPDTVLCVIRVRHWLQVFILMALLDRGGPDDLASIDDYQQYLVVALSSAPERREDAMAFFMALTGWGRDKQADAVRMEQWEQLHREILRQREVNKPRA